MLKKPVYLRSETWDFIKQHWQSLNETQKKQILENPGRFLVENGILTKPSLLQNTVIEQLDDGPDYIITTKAAEELARGGEKITLIRLYDEKTRLFSRSEVLNSLNNGHIFDQLAL